MFKSNQHPVTEKGMETDYQIKRIIVCFIVIVNEKKCLFSQGHM